MSSKPISNDKPLRDCSALVIEGNPRARAMLMGQLRELGASTLEPCARLKEARRKLEKAHFDVVVCEQHFEREGDSGQAFLDELRRNHVLPFQTIFIMLTAEASYNSVAEAAEAALDAYILKPYTAARLGERLLAARERKEAMAPIFHAMEAKDFDQATALCIERFNARGEHWLHAARIGAELELRAGHLAEAEAMYRAVIDAQTLPWARLGVARAQLQAGQHKRALSTLESLLNDDDSYADAYDLIGRIHFEQGRFEQALSTYATATRLTPGSVGRLLKHGMLAFYNGDRAEGVALLDKAAQIGLESKQFDPQALVLLALARLDDNDARGLIKCVDQLARLVGRSFDPKRPARLLSLVHALHGMLNQMSVIPQKMATGLMAEVHEPDFDIEAACNLISLLERMEQRGITPEGADACIQKIALRFGVNRAMSDMLAGAAQGQPSWQQMLAQGHADIIRITEQAMRLSLKGDPTGTVKQLLIQAKKTRNAKLVESAHQVMNRYTDQIRQRDGLAQHIDQLRSLCPMPGMRLSSQAPDKSSLEWTLEGRPKPADKPNPFMARAPALA